LRSWPGTGLHIGEALGLKIGDHLSGDFSTIRVRQSVWRGSVETPDRQRCSRNRRSIVAGRSLEGQCRRQDNRVSLSDGVGRTADAAQRSARRSRQDLRGYEVGRRKGVSFFPSFPNCTPAKEPSAVGPAKAVTWSRQQSVTDRYAEQLKQDIDWRKEEAERAGWGVRVADNREFS
jgi:hypothetical protein